MHQCCLTCEIFQYCPVRLQRTAKYSPLLSKLCYRWSHCPVRSQWPVRYTSVLSGHKTQRSVSPRSYYETQHCTISASFQILWKFSCLPFLRNHFSIIICGFCWWLNVFFFHLPWLLKSLNFRLSAPNPVSLQTKPLYTYLYMWCPPLTSALSFLNQILICLQLVSIANFFITQSF